MSEDFTSDYTGNEGFNSGEAITQENGKAKGTNGSGDGAGKDSGAAEAPGRDDERKLFVGGLSWESSEKELRDYFGQFGEIESVNVKTDPNTGRSRGFAFLVFSNTETIDKVLGKSEHIINGKKVDPKKAKARHGKIFVGGLKPEMSDDDIKNHFSAMGTVVEVEMPMDKVKNTRKGFCFITFEQEAVVQDLIRTGKTKIKDIEVDVKKATPKPDGGRGGMRGAPRGGRGYGGYGGYGGYDGYGGYGGYDGGYGGGYGGGYDGGQGYSGGKQRGGRGGSSGGSSRHQPY
ncbi:RNA-binding protein squid-like isoform X6 [Amphibalanus amphitrite]|uniref:RNA-binding protein squid-like isoform X6 n=1 Tax=Amphibalanus amphitrite TaxID=1232801 RepID=UPI001C91EE55|nr:RNA-binding protein squid-like isoform X6 [Amphibalanus amphitrite]